MGAKDQSKTDSYLFRVPKHIKIPCLSKKSKLSPVYEWSCYNV